jgi:hypothetical protein
VVYNDERGIILQDTAADPQGARGTAPHVISPGIYFPISVQLVRLTSQPFIFIQSRTL